MRLLSIQLVSSPSMRGLSFCRYSLASRAWHALTPLSSLITSSNNGYDGSMMNGLQTLPQWKDYFHAPSGSMLGLLNAIQVYSLLDLTMQHISDLFVA